MGDAIAAVWVSERRYITRAEITCGGPDLRMLLHAGENPWSQTPKGLSFCSRDARLKEMIVLAVGEDPATVTEAGMDLGNHRFLTYSRSVIGGDDLNIFGWRGLVSNVDLLWCYN